MKKRLLFFIVLAHVFIEGWGYNVQARSLNPDFYIDGVYYRYNAGRESVSITYGRGGTQFNRMPATYAGDMTIPESVTYNDVTYPVTRIDSYTFCNCIGLTSLTIPNSITSFGEGAFYNCTGLTEINIPNSVETIGELAFYNCIALTEIDIPNSVKAIEEEAFNTAGFISITIPGSVETIKKGAFKRCPSLKNVIIKEGVKTIGSSAFSECKALETISFPDGLTTIEDGAFFWCLKLSDITIPSTVSYIGNQAFRACSGLNIVNILCDLADIEIETEVFVKIGTEIFRSCGEINVYLNDYYTAMALCLNQDFGTGTTTHLYVNGEIITHFETTNKISTIRDGAFSGLPDMKSIDLSNRLTSIGNYAFYQSGLEKVIFPETVTSIGEHAFENCSSLSELTFGKNIRTLGTAAFLNCTGISKVEIGDLKNWCGIAFEGGDYDIGNKRPGYASSNPLSYAKKIYLKGNQLDELTIPSGITEISGYAFNNCLRFDKLTIPASVTKIGEYAFSQCADLENVVFKNTSSLESLGNGAFWNCTALQSIQLPASLNTIGNAIFRGCTNLVSATLPDNLTIITRNMFYGCQSLGSIAIPDHVETIGDFAFEGCKGLTRIDISPAVKAIGTEAFKDCTGLKGVYIQDLTAWCKICFGNDQYQGSNWEPSDKESNPLIMAHNLFLNNELLVDMIVPENVDGIMPFTFWGAYCLKSVVISEGCKTLGRKAFNACVNLRKVVIPNSMDIIEEYAFTNIRSYYSENKVWVHNNEPINLYISNIEKYIANAMGNGLSGAEVKANLYLNGDLIRDLVIPNSITRIDKYALLLLRINSLTLHKDIERIDCNCLEGATLKTIYSKSKFAPELSGYYNYFYRVTSLKTIYVPSGSGNKYKTSWEKYSDIIKEASGDMILDGEQTSEDIISSMSACSVLNESDVTSVDLTAATLGDDVTAEALHEAGENSNVIFYMPTGSTVTGTNIVVDGEAEQVEFTSQHSISIPSAFTTPQLSYAHQLEKRNYAYTLCLPYDFTLPNGLVAYTLSKKNASGHLVFEKEKSGTIEANKPYLVKAGQEVSNLNATEVSVRVSEEIHAGIDGYDFVGTLSAISASEAESMGAYVLNDQNEWLPVTEESEGIKPGTAYLIPTSAPEKIKCILIGEGSGDANGDSDITLTDAVDIIRYILGEVPEGFDVKAVDMNGDGIINVADAVNVIDIILQQ